VVELLRTNLTLRNTPLHHIAKRMSFQDLGRGRGVTAGKGKQSTFSSTKTKTNTGALSIGYVSSKENEVESPPSSTNALLLASSGGPNSNSSASSSSKMFATVSDTILQFQRNVAILSTIAKSIVGATSISSKRAPSSSSTTTHTNRSTDDEEVLATLNQQYAVQRDVVTQLQNRIERQLREAEVELASIQDRAEATQARNAHIKMTRDFRTMESVYKNLILTVRQRQQLVHTQREYQRQQEQAAMEEQESQQRMMLQLQRDEDNVNLQIMREREEEIRKINQGMITVNEIYKDLSRLVTQQQEDVDKVELHVEQSNMHAKQGLIQLEKANMNADRSCIIS